jgi:hypothetical protein
LGFSVSLTKVYYSPQEAIMLVLDKLKEHNMSRTYKDKPYKFVNPEQDWDYRHTGILYTRQYRSYNADGGWEWAEYEATRYLEKAGVLTKKKKHQDIEHHWMTTPSWWTRLYMLRPQRARENQQLRNIQVLEDFDFVDTGRKPHVYYW